MSWVTRALFGATLVMLVVDIVAMQEGPLSTIVVPPDALQAAAPLESHQLDAGGAKPGQDSGEARK